MVDMDVLIKKCGKCGEEKRIKCFWISKCNPDGYDNFCKECRKYHTEKKKNKDYQFCKCGCGELTLGITGYANRHYFKSLERNEKHSKFMKEVFHSTVNTTKDCKKCRKVKDINEFLGPRSWYCLDCVDDKYKAHSRSKTPEQNKNSFLKSKYGITLKEYYIISEKQNNVCAICLNPETRKSRYGGICKLHVDHDHKSGEVRGLLCNFCNKALGYFRDNPLLLKSAIEYLNKIKKNKQIE